MTEKWSCPSLGFYKSISEFPAISHKHICERKPEVLVTFEAGHIVAKKFVKGKPQYMVKWFNFCASENTWERKDHLLLALVEAFENPERKKERTQKKVSRPIECLRIVFRKSYHAFPSKYIICIVAGETKTASLEATKPNKVNTIFSFMLLMRSSYTHN